MNLRSTLIILIGSFAFFTACRKSENITPTRQQPVLRVNTPFSGSMTFNLTTSSSFCNCASLGNPMIQSQGVFQGTGQMTYFGNCTSVIEPCAGLNFVNGVPVGIHVAMECGSFVAANGDEVYCSIPPYDLPFTATGPNGTITVNFNGGTGRFTNATGGFTANLAVQGPIAYLTNISGNINY